MKIRTTMAACILLSVLASAAVAQVFLADLLSDVSGCSPALSLHQSIERKIHTCFLVGRMNAEQRAHVYYRRGLLYHLSGKYELALADYTNAIIWQRNLYGAYEARGDAYEDLGQRDKASADYAQAAAMQVDDTNALAQQCWLRAFRGHPLDRALTECTKALSADPNSNYILDTRCLVYYRMANYKAAIADCDKANSNRSRDASALYVDGLAKLRLGDSSGGNSDIAAAHDADFHVADVFALYGVTR